MTTLYMKYSFSRQKYRAGVLNNFHRVSSDFVNFNSSFMLQMCCFFPPLSFDSYCDVAGKPEEVPLKMLISCSFTFASLFFYIPSDKSNLASV